MKLKEIKILLVDYPHALPVSVKNALRVLHNRQDWLADSLWIYRVEELEDKKDQAPMDILLWVKNNSPDELTLALALVLGFRDSEELGLLDHLHATDPNLTILGVVPDRNGAFIEQLCPRRREIVNPTENSMVAALCGAIRHAM